MKISNKLIILVTLIIFALTINSSSVFAGSRTYYTTLRFGSVGEDVKQLQQQLNSKGYWAGSADGIYGKMTEKAVISFQIADKLIVDGIAGNQTLTALFKGSYDTDTDAFNLYKTNLYWMSRIIHAEAEAESYEGKVAVGSVVMNRLNSNLFPNSVKGVIFDEFNGIPQFTPVKNGAIYNNPSHASVQAAEDALNGTKPVSNSTYFFNPDKSAATWIVQNKSYVKTIGNHAFYQ